MKITTKGIPKFKVVLPSADEPSDKISIVNDDEELIIHFDSRDEIELLATKLIVLRDRCRNDKSSFNGPVKNCCNCNKVKKPDNIRTRKQEKEMFIDRISKMSDLDIIRALEKRLI